MGKRRKKQAKAGKKPTKAELRKLLAPAITKAKGHLKREKEYATRSKELRIRRDIEAFRVGKIIDRDVIKKYGDKAIETFAKACGMKTPTARGHQYLARGAVKEQVIRKNPHLNRKYFQILGRSIRFDDTMGIALHRALLHRPVMIEEDGETKPDIETLKDIGRVLKATRKRIVETYGRNPLAVKFTTDEAYETKKFRQIIHRSEFPVLRDEAILMKDVADIAGWDKPPGVFLQGKEIPVTSVAPRHGKPSARGTTYRRNRQQMINQALKQATPDTIRSIDSRVMLGRCESLLTSRKHFPKHLVDVVITDPPYSKEYYRAWRPTTKVAHDEEKTIKEQAALVGKVAAIIARREILKPKAMWFSFCPLNFVHEFLPPILSAFKKKPVTHQVLIWDKQKVPKIGGHRFFSHQAEAIIYVNQNRPLGELRGKGRSTVLHPSILSHEVDPKGEENEFWKPIPLLEQLIRLSTYENDDKRARRQVILDPFAGSGSTGVAAINCHRDFRLIESHKGQFKTAKEAILLALDGTN